MAADIFVSFASKDVRVAMTLCAALENRGFTCWISARNIEPGENFQSAIVRALRQAKIMLLVFTANSNTSEEMTKELALASQNKMIVIPLRVEDVTPNDAFAYEFATRQWIDVFADWEVAIEQLSRRIGQALLDRSAGKGGAAADALKTVIASANAAKLADLAPAGEDDAPPPPTLDVPPGDVPPLEAAVQALEALEASAEPAAEFESWEAEVTIVTETAADAELPPSSEDDLWPAAAAESPMEEAPPEEPPAARKPVGLLIGATVAILVLVGLVIILANRGGGSKAPPAQAAAPTAATPPKAVTPQQVATPPVAAPPVAASSAAVAPPISDEAPSSQPAAVAAPKPVKHKKAQPKVDIPF
jgi:hypothetical protein